MKRLGKKIGALLLALLTTSVVAAGTAAAEDNGYWTTQPDNEGNMVWIYHYTEPVEYTIVEGSNDVCTLQGDEEPTPEYEPRMCYLRESTQPGHTVEAISMHADMTQINAAVRETLGQFTSLAVWGVVFLAVMGVCLYKIL